MIRNNELECYLKELFIVDHNCFVTLERAQQILNEFCMKKGITSDLVGPHLLRAFPHTRYTKAHVDGRRRVVFDALRRAD